MNERKESKGRRRKLTPAAAAKKLGTITDLLLKMESTVNRIYDLCIDINSSNERHLSYSVKLGKMFGYCFSLMQYASEVETIERELNRSSEEPSKESKHYTEEANHFLKSALNQLLIYQEIFFEGNPGCRETMSKIIDGLKRENPVLGRKDCKTEGTLLK